MQCQLLNLRLPAIGTIFLTPQLPSPDIPGSRKVFPLGERYFIGAKSMTSSDFDKGPWTSCADYLIALIDNQLHFLAHCPPASLAVIPPGDKLTPSYLIRCYQYLRAGILSCLSLHFQDMYDPVKCPLVLCHPDLAQLNIMVSCDEPDKVTGLLDWEGTTIIPMWESSLGYRLLGDGPGHVVKPHVQTAQLRALFESTVVKNVPDYEEICARADKLHLRGLKYLVQSATTFIAMQSKSNAANHFGQWIDCIEEQYRVYFDELKVFIHI